MVIVISGTLGELDLELKQEDCRKQETGCGGIISDEEFTINLGKYVNCEYKLIKNNRRVCQVGLRLDTTSPTDCRVEVEGEELLCGGGERLFQLGGKGLKLKARGDDQRARLVGKQVAGAQEIKSQHESRRNEQERWSRDCCHGEYFERKFTIVLPKDSTGSHCVYRIRKASWNTCRYLYI